MRLASDSTSHGGDNMEAVDADALRASARRVRGARLPSRSLAFVAVGLTLASCAAAPAPSDVAQQLAKGGVCHDVSAKPGRGPTQYVCVDGQGAPITIADLNSIVPTPSHEYVVRGNGWLAVTTQRATADAIVRVLGGDISIAGE